MAADKFMVAKINDTKFVEAIKENQTPKLIAKFRKQFPDDLGTLGILDQVALMTPENIHVNAFMYEPIIDMSDDQLKKLWAAVKALP